MNKIVKKVREEMEMQQEFRYTKAALRVFVCLFVFIVVYALILPALALEDQASCGLSAHEHGEACYEKKLVCNKEEHTHDDQCYDQDGNLICEIEEHTHASPAMKRKGN